MSLLDFDDTYKPPYKKPRPYKPEVGDNMAEMNNLGRKKVAEDYGDSPHADRKPEQEDAVQGSN